MLESLRSLRKEPFRSIPPDRSPGRHPFVESVDRFVAAFPKLAGKRILLCGDNVTVFLTALRVRGARVDVAVGVAKARDRVLRRFPDAKVVVPSHGAPGGPPRGGRVLRPGRPRGPAAHRPARPRPALGASLGIPDDPPRRGRPGLPLVR